VDELEQGASLEKKPATTGATLKHSFLEMEWVPGANLGLPGPSLAWHEKLRVRRQRVAPFSHLSAQTKQSGMLCFITRKERPGICLVEVRYGVREGGVPLQAHAEASLPPEVPTTQYSIE
jgi:hypothetical protein